MMNSVFHIMVAANERYMPGAEVACAGVAIKAKPETELQFHVFTEDVLTSSIARMEASLKRLHSRSVVHQHVCSDELLKGLPYWGGSRMAAVRCLVANILHDVRWCLYLDCDILYLASVEEHFRIVTIPFMHVSYMRRARVTQMEVLNGLRSSVTLRCLRPAILTLV